MGRKSADTLASRAKPAAQVPPDSSEEEQERLGKRGLPDSSEDEEQRVITIARKRSQGCQDVSKQADGGTAAVKEEGGTGREGQAGAGAPGGKRVPPASIEDEEEQKEQTTIARCQDGSEADEADEADAAAGEADEDETLGQMPGSNDGHDTDAFDLHVSQPQPPSDSSDSEIDDVPLGHRVRKQLAEEPQSKPVKKRPRGEPQEEANRKARRADPESPLTLTLH